jgi:DNA-directed RNA polymerase specialized sigma24 family protein
MGAATEGKADRIGGDILDAKEFLNQVKKLDLQIKNKLIEKQQWKDIALGITSNMDGDRVQSSGRKTKMADAIDKCVDMEAEIDRLVDKLIDTKKEVIAVIEQLDSPTQYDVLHMIYIQGKSLQEVADSYGMSYDWATTTHGRALKNVRAIIERSKHD